MMPVVDTMAGPHSMCLWFPHGARWWHLVVGGEVFDPAVYVPRREAKAEPADAAELDVPERALALLVRVDGHGVDGRKEAWLRLAWGVCVRNWRRAGLDAGVGGDQVADELADVVRAEGGVDA